MAVWVVEMAAMPTAAPIVWTSSKNLAIPTPRLCTFHMYSDQWGYNYSWSNTWIKDHDEIGAQVNKSVVPEYGAQGPNTTAVEQQWQAVVVEGTGIAYDSFWQLGATLPSGTSITGSYAIEYGTAEDQILVLDHVQLQPPDPSSITFSGKYVKAFYPWMWT